MTASDLLNRVWRAYRGKGATKTPAWGSEKANLVLDIANQAQEEWAKDSNQAWSSLFNIVEVDTIDTSVFTYELPVNFMTPSDYFLLDKTDGSRIELPLIKPQQRDGQLYISGSNPKKVTFSCTNIDTTYNGGSLKAPAYYMPASITDSTDVITVDDPNWLVYATAAELARNDAAKEDQYPNLLGKANDLYKKMIDANNNVGFMQGGKVLSNMTQLGDLTEDWSI